MTGKRVLIVDDSKSALFKLSKMLRLEHYQVETASSGEQALVYLEDNQPDLIFLDHIMPGLDGFEVLTKLKKNPDTQTIPVIMYTSRIGDDYTSHAKRLGASGILSKQFGSQDLLDAISGMDEFAESALHVPPKMATAKIATAPPTQETPVTPTQIDTPEPESLSEPLSESDTLEDYIHASTAENASDEINEIPVTLSAEPATESIVEIAEEAEHMAMDHDIEKLIKQTIRDQYKKLSNEINRNSKIMTQQAVVESTNVFKESHLPEMTGQIRSSLFKTVFICALLLVPFLLYQNYQLIEQKNELKTMLTAIEAIKPNNNVSVVAPKTALSESQILQFIEKINRQEQEFQRRTTQLVNSVETMNEKNLSDISLLIETINNTQQYQEDLNRSYNDSSQSIDDQNVDENEDIYDEE